MIDKKELLELLIDLKDDLIFTSDYFAHQGDLLDSEESDLLLKRVKKAIRDLKEDD